MREPEDLKTFELAFHAERSPVPACGSSHTLSCTTLLLRCSTGSRVASAPMCSSTVRFSSSGFVRPVRIRGEFHVGALLMLPWVAEKAPRTTFNVSAQSLQPFPVVLSWFLHPRGELTSCCTEVRAVLRHVTASAVPRRYTLPAPCGKTFKRSSFFRSSSLKSSAIMGEFTGLHFSCQCISTVPEHASRCPPNPDTTPANE